jgi:hypothetical protein
MPLQASIKVRCQDGSRPEVNGDWLAIRTLSVTIATLLCEHRTHISIADPQVISFVFIIGFNTILQATSFHHQFGVVHQNSRSLDDDFGTVITVALRKSMTIIMS